MVGDSSSRKKKKGVVIVDNPSKHETLDKYLMIFNKIGFPTALIGLSIAGFVLFCQWSGPKVDLAIEVGIRMVDGLRVTNESNALVAKNQQESLHRLADLLEVNTQLLETVSSRQADQYNHYTTVESLLREIKRFVEMPSATRQPIHDPITTPIQPLNPTLAPPLKVNP